MSETLNDVRVADLSIVTAGGATTQVLADFGADVIKIEGPEHPDLFRYWDPAIDDPNKGDLYFAPFRTVNRGKRGIAVDIKRPEGLEVILRLVAKSDAVVENFRRGALERLGLGFDRLVEANEKIVLVSLASQGVTGPNAPYGSFGSTLEALGGLMSITGYDEETPLWSTNKVNYPDQSVSLLAPALIIFGILAPRESGVARWIDLSQREVVTSLLGEAVLGRSLGGPDPVPAANEGSDGYGWCSPCSGDDNWVAISLFGDRDRRACADVVGYTGLSDEPEPRTTAQLRDKVGSWTASRSRAEAMAAFQSVGVAAASVMKGWELFDDAYFRQIGFFQAVELPGGGTELQRGSPVRFDDDATTQVRGRAPHLGEHTVDVLTGLLDYTKSEVRRLLEEGVIKAT